MKEFYTKNAITYGNDSLTKRTLTKFMRRGLILKCYPANCIFPFKIYFDSKQNIFIFDDGNDIEEIDAAYDCFLNEDNKIEVIRPIITRILTLKD